jgi:hypothetical protein
VSTHGAPAPGEVPVFDINDGFEPLQRQIDRITASVDAGFNRIETMLREIELRVRATEKQEAACSPLVNSKIDVAWRTIDTHSAQIDGLVKLTTDLVQTNRVLKWILGVSTMILVAVVIEIMRGGLVLLKP